MRNYEKLVENIRKKGIKVYLAPKGDTVKLTQASIRFIIERNLTRLGKESLDADSFFDVSAQLENVIDHKR